MNNKETNKPFSLSLERVTFFLTVTVLTTTP